MLNEYFRRLAAIWSNGYWWGLVVITFLASSRSWQALIVIDVIISLVLVFISMLLDTAE